MPLHHLHCPRCHSAVFELRPEGAEWEEADLWLAPAGVQVSLGRFGLNVSRPYQVRCGTCRWTGSGSGLVKGRRRARPKGLIRCPVCGELRGAGATCRCSNIVCRHCGKPTKRKPISNYYDESTGRFMHVAWLEGIAPCRECGR